MPHLLDMKAIPSLRWLAGEVIEPVAAAAGQG